MSAHDTPLGGSHAEDLALAHRLADAADAISLARFRAADLRVESKPDHTPVTDADKAVERRVREILAAERPGDAVLGEEEGETGVGATRRWILDPIDGTKSYARGVPVWATLLALEIDDVVTLGVVSAPALARRWWAAIGAGARVRDPGTAAEGRPLQVSAVSRLADASISYSSLSGWQEIGRLDGLLALCGSVWRTRAYGDFWSHLLVAEGVVDVAAEPEVSLWDLAALEVIVGEAGGTFTALDGTPGSRGGSVVVTNGLLHQDALGFLGGPA